MGAALEVVSGQATAPSTTLTAWTVASGNSLTIRSASMQSTVKLLAAWANNNAAGILRVRSPRLHDNVQGIRMRVDASDVRPILPRHMFAQKLYPQDTLTVEQSGSAVGGQIESGSLLLYYADLPGINGRFITDGQVAAQGVNIIGQEVQLAPGATGGYSGQVAITANFDNFKANIDYAIVGLRVDVNCTTV